MNKTIYLLFLSLLFLGCKTYKALKTQNNDTKEAFLSYHISLNITQKESSLLNNKHQNSFGKKNNSKIDYYLFRDSVRINDIDGKTIFIPKRIKKLVNRKNWKTEHFEVIDYKLITKNWQVKYQIKIDKKDQIKILGIEGYKVIITENYLTPSGTKMENISELYVSDIYNIPFNNYEFLKLRRNINFKGLIIQLKRYNTLNPNNYNLYNISQFNTDKQDRDLIKINNLKKIEK